MDAARRAILGGARGFAAGYAFQAAFDLIKATMKGKIQARGGLKKLVLANEEAVEFGRLLGGMVFLYRGSGSLLSASGLIQSRAWRSGVAGFASGLSILQTRRDQRFVTALYCIVRALADLRAYATHECGYARSEFGSELLFLMANIPITWAMFTEPRHMNRGYHKLTSWVADSYGSRATSNMCASHPGQSCSEYYTSTLCSGMGRTGLMYAKVYTFSALLRPNKAFTKPRAFVYEKLSNLARSALFLTIYQANAKAVLCHYRAARKKHPNLVGLLAGLLGGMSIFVERKSRRRELSLYCAPRALEILINKYVETFCGPDSVWVRRGPDVSALAFCLSFGIWLFLTNHPTFRNLNGLNKGILNVLFGVRVKKVKV